VAKAALAALSMAILAAMVVLTIAFSGGQPAYADNKFGGAGETVTQSNAPTTLDTPSAAPVVLATAYGS
jgi:hypothetical protein